MNAMWKARWSLAARSVGAIGLFGLLAGFALVVGSFVVSFPEELSRDPPGGRRIYDRDGLLLARTMAEDGVFRAPVRPGETGPHLVKALIAAEDQRFRTHVGLDFIAIARATVRSLTHGRLVSGASTLTQQLARTTFERPRSLTGKLREMALALAIERRLSKDEILRHYLNRVHFGPQIVGVRAAADHYFGKEPTALDVSEAATLVGLVRGPSWADPRLRPERARRERDRVLGRLHAEGSISRVEYEQARAVPVAVMTRPPLPGAHHWVRVVARRSVGQELRTTLHGKLQAEAEALVSAWRRSASDHEISAAAVIVLDNESGDILAYVGSPDFEAQVDGGQNDGVAALRQPGSTLKPFIYAAAIDELGLDAASLLPDEELVVRTPTSFYTPENFDRTFRGPVRLRRALANSLNVPAVAVLEKLGGSRVLQTLRDVGLSTLDEPAEHYGPALALGDGEVSLSNLAAAYASLARGGVTVRPRLLLSETSPPGRRVFSAEASAVITEILSDDASRREAFGARNALDLPFAAAVKTGTSKGYRDNWTVGYTRAVTVGVWVGNFDGRPTVRMTGARGAGPLFASVMLAAARQLGPRVTAPGRTRPLHDVALVRRPVECWNPGDPSGSAILEWFVSSGRQATRHLVSPRCQAASVAAPREQLPAEYEVTEPRIAFPVDGMTFHFDPAVGPERQRLVIKGDRNAPPVARLFVDGASVATHEGRGEWPLQRGRHRIVAESDHGRRSLPVDIFVNYSRLD